MTFRVLFLLSSLVGPSLALAESGWYGKPQANVRAIQVNNQTVVQATAGVEGGLRYGLSSSIKGRTRAGMVGIYGLNTGSAGADLRVGSFIGPAGKTGYLMFGPDLWVNGYGGDSSTDYRLDWAPGLSLPANAGLTLSPAFRLIGAVTPGWAFDERRKQGGIGPFDELGLLGAGVLNVGSAYLTLGYQQTWNNVGVIRGVILSGAI